MKKINSAVPGRANLQMKLQFQGPEGNVWHVAAFKQELAGGTKLVDLMAQVNHPNQRGHELVAKALLAWFP